MCTRWCRPRSLSDLPKAPPPTPVSGVATVQVPPASMSMPTAENLVLASPAGFAGAALSPDVDAQGKNMRNSRWTKPQHWVAVLI
jgi:hypothetical protein